MQYNVHVKFYSQYLTGSEFLMGALFVSHPSAKVFNVRKNRLVRVGSRYIHCPFKLLVIHKLMIFFRQAFIDSFQELILNFVTVHPLVKAP